MLIPTGLYRIVLVGKTVLRKELIRFVNYGQKTHIALQIPDRQNV